MATSIYLYGVVRSQRSADVSNITALFHKNTQSPSHINTHKLRVEPPYLYFVLLDVKIRRKSV